MDSPDRVECEWSYSKSALFAHCPRAFYHRYSPGESLSDRPVDEIDEWDADAQATFSGFGLLIGDAIHTAINTEIDEWRSGDRPRRQRAKTIAEQYVEDHFDSVSAQIRDSSTDSGTSQPELTRTTSRHIDTFIDSLWPNFREHDYINHESLHSLDIDQYRVLLRPDFLTRSQDGEFVITDWKTGTPPVLSPRSPQLHVYALWARDTFEPNTSRIRAQTAHTSDGAIKPTPIREEHLSDIEARITAECERWITDNSESDYPALPEQAKCSRCAFLPRCPEGQSEVDPRSTNS